MGEGQGTRAENGRRGQRGTQLGQSPIPGRGQGRRGEGRGGRGPGGTAQGSGQALALRGPQGGSTLSSICRNVQDGTPGERLPSGTLHHLLLGREAKVNALQNGFITG